MPVVSDQVFGYEVGDAEKQVDLSCNLFLWPSLLNTLDLDRVRAFLRSESLIKEWQKVNAWTPAKN